MIHRDTTPHTVALIILTYNEEANIVQALGSVTGWASEIFILDSLSSDRTLEIAHQYGCYIAQNKFENFAKQRNHALEHLSIRSEWVLFLDADEWLPDALKHEISALIATDPEENGFYINRRLIWMGRWIRRGYYPSWILRLFRYGKGRCEDRAVNEHLIVDGATGRLRNDFIHEDRKGVTDWIAKHNGYATREALEIFNTRAARGYQEIDARLFGAQAQRKRWLRLKVWNRLPPLVRPFVYFFYRYVLQGGFLDGRAGFVFHFLHALWYPMLIDVKYLEYLVKREQHDSGSDIRMGRSSATPTPKFSSFVPRTFNSPEQLPSSKDEAQEWQEANRSFWESSPMRYDWKKEIEFEGGSKRFFEEIDRRFFSNVKPFMPWKHIPFDNLIPFDELKHRDVLEIGVGLGSHASLLAARAHSYTGIDLTAYAVKMTADRMKMFEREANIRQMDAEDMKFPDSTFDFIWSWGVIHHSSNTRRILQEIHRVLKPGGQAVIMVYNRGWWNYYICGGVINCLIRGRIFRSGSLAKSIQADTDGALARYYSARSWKILAGEYFNVKYVTVKGAKTDVFPIPGGQFKDALMSLLPDSVARFLTHQCGMGGFLISGLVKN